MKRDQMIPIYSADGKSLGFRTLEAAERLVSGGHVKPAYARKGRLKAIFLPREDGGNPVEVQSQPGTRYSFLQSLDSGRCWSLRRLDVTDEDGNRVSTRSDYFRVLAGCLRP
jgi:hypothetical protein